MIEILLVWGCWSVRTGWTEWQVECVPQDSVGACADPRQRREEAVYSIIGLHLQVTCLVLSSAKLQRKVVTAQQTQSFVRLGTML